MDNKQTSDVASQGTCAIEFRNVSVSFDDNRALSDICFQLHHGEMIAITGVAGSGKSVLLRVAIGLLKAARSRGSKKKSFLKCAARGSVWSFKSRRCSAV